MRYRKYLALGCAAIMATSLLFGCTGSQQSADTSEEAGTNEAENTTIVQVTAIDGTTITADVGEISGMGGGAGGDMDKPSGETSTGEDGEDSIAEDGQAPADKETPPDKPSGETSTGEDGEDSIAEDGQAPADKETPPDKPSGDSGTDEGGEDIVAEGGQAPADGETPPDKPSGDSGTGESGEDIAAEGGQAPADGEAPSDMPSGDGTGGDMPDGQGGGFGGGFTATGDSITFTITDDTVITVQSMEDNQDGTIDDITVGSILELVLNEDNEAESVVIRNTQSGGESFGGSSEVTNGTAATTISEDGSIENETYTSSGDDENALRIDGAAVTLDGITVEKTGGDSSNTEDGDFYGQNAALLALNGADVTIRNANVTTDAVNGNGVFSYGEGTTVTISDSVIRTSQNNSGGIQTTGGGTTNASNLDVETQGNSSAAIRSDRGGGTVNVEGGTYVTNGTGSPAVYSTADISVSDATLTANASEGVVVEGKNSVSLVNCNVTGNMDNTYQGDSDENIHCIMIYQSMSGDADVGEADFSAEGGSITAKTGDMFYITNTDCKISLKNVSFTLSNEVFLRVEGNSSSRGWGTEGENGGAVVLDTEAQTIEGNILVDSISSLDFTMGDGTALTGAINADNTGGTVTVTMEAGSTWTLTGDSYISGIEGDTSGIITNGYHLYVDGEEFVDN